MARAGFLGEVVEESPVGDAAETLPVDDVVEPVEEVVEPVEEVIEPPPPAAESVPEQTPTPRPPPEVVNTGDEPPSGGEGTESEIAEPAGSAPTTSPTVAPAPVGPPDNEPTSAAEPGGGALLAPITEPLADTVDTVFSSVGPAVGDTITGVAGTAGGLVDDTSETLDEVVGTVVGTVDPLVPDPGIVATVGGVPPGPRQMETTPVEPAPRRDSGQVNVPPTNHVPGIETPPDQIPDTPAGPTPPTEKDGLVAGMAIDRPVLPMGKDPPPVPVDPGQTQPTRPVSDGWGRTVLESFTSSSGPNSGHVFGFVAVLILLGLMAPRLSCWLRLQPLLWRSNALALAIERPG